MEYEELRDEMAEGYVIGDTGPLGSLTGVSRAGKFMGDFNSMTEAVRWIYKDMNAKKYWPNVFYVNDHGNVELLRIYKNGRYRYIEGWV